MIEVIEKIDGLVTLKSAGEARGVSADTVFSYAARHNIPLKRIGRTLLIDEKDLQEYRKGHDANSTIGTHSTGD